MTATRRLIELTRRVFLSDYFSVERKIIKFSIDSVRMLN